MRGSTWLGLGVLALLALASSSRRPMNIKQDVNLGDSIPPQTIQLLDIVSRAWARYGLTPTMTSLWRDTPGSLHSKGLAVDFRTRDLPSGMVFNLAADVTREAGPEWQAIIEEGPRRWYYRGGMYEGSRADAVPAAPHIHFEFDRPRSNAT